MRKDDVPGLFIFLTGYIYPGAKLALVGKFKSNVMIAGQRADIIQATCKNNMVSVKFGKPDGPKFHLR